MTRHYFKTVALIGMMIAACVLSFSAAAQNRLVRGSVFDQNGEPVIGAAVMLVGNSSVGTVTDIDGLFSINVPENSSLEVSFIGYATQVVEVGKKDLIKVFLEEDTQFLDETVVIGYGIQKKSDLTGAVASVREEEFQNRSTADAAAALQGKAAGVQVITNNGAPGTASEIRVRGVSSNSGNIGPLLIVDGLKVDNIQYLDPEMIQSMEILKDGASAAIYGAEAGNGVVLITTKTGAASKGHGKIFYNGQWQISTISHKMDIMNASDYIAYGKSRGWLTDTMLQQNYDGVTDVNWTDELFVPSWSNKQTVGFQGGNEHGNLFISINNNHQNGIVRGDKDVYDRLTFQVNADYKIKKWLTVGTNNSIEKWKTKSVTQQDDNGSFLLSAITSTPLFSPRGTYDELSDQAKAYGDNGYRLIEDPENEGYYWIAPKIGETQSGHPYVRRDATDTDKGGFNIRGTTYLNFNPFKGFVFTSRLGYRISQNTSHNYTAKYYSTNTLKSDNYTIDAAANTGYYYQWENFINYNNTFGKHGVTAMAGMSYIENNWDNVSVSATGTDILKSYESNFRYIDYLKPGDGVAKTMNNLPGRTASLSYFGRLGYTYDNRYSIQLNFRADAFDSSKLPADKRWGYFPSVSGGWTISNERWVKDNVDAKAMSFLKLRASWGRNGNINVLSNYPYSTSMLINSTFYQYVPGNTAATLGSIQAGLANEDLTWETSEQWDIGLDARFLNDRLSFTIDYFNKKTKDLLVGVKPSKSVGLMPAYDIGMNDSVTMNAGNVLNTGLEIEAGWKDSAGDFHYSINANASWLKNEVTYLDPTVGRITGRVPQGTQAGTMFSQGESVWYLYGYKFLGVNDEGKGIYESADGTPTTSPSSNDRQVLGSSVPKFIYGITLNFEWKGIDLNIFGTGVAGNTIFPTSWRSDRPECNTYSWYWNNSWKQPGDQASAKFPAAKYWDEVAFSSSASMWCGDYFKIKQIQLGYTFPSRWMEKAFIQRLRIYASLDNFITFTKYPGLDPETATTGGSAAGIDMGTYPTSKSFIFGVNLEF